MTLYIFNVLNFVLIHDKYIMKLIGLLDYGKFLLSNTVSDIMKSKM